MPTDKKHRLPQFTLGSLLLLTTAVAIGVVVSQQPALERDPWALPFEEVSPISQGLLSAGVVLTIAELIRHSLLLGQQHDKVDFQLRLTLNSMTWLRLTMALSMAGLLLFRLLLNRGVVELLEHKYRIFLSFELWPDLLLLLLLILSMRLMLGSRKKLSRSVLLRLLSGLVVGLGVACVGCYVLTDLLGISFLVHLAIDGVEKSHAFLWQRPNVFPNHLAEGYQSFWASFWALCLVLLAVVSLLLSTNVKSRWLLAIVWSTFVVCVAMVASYVWWFATREFPRISPELAGAPSPLIWSDVLAGLILLFGLGTVCGFQLARQRSEQSSKEISRSTVSGLMAIGAGAIALSTGYDWLRMFEGNFPMVLMMSTQGNWLNDKITAVVQLILYPEMMVPLAALLSSCTIIWRFFKPLDSVEQLQLVSVWHLVGYSLAVIVLLVVAVPCLAAFGFCYWLGPWVL